MKMYSPGFVLPLLLSDYTRSSLGCCACTIWIGTLLHERIAKPPSPALGWHPLHTTL